MKHGKRSVQKREVCLIRLVMIKEIRTRLGVKKIEMIEWEGGEIPKTIYKYRDWKNEFHRNVILKQEMFVPSPEDFNDPFDCKIPVAYDMLLEDKELARTFLRRMADKNYIHLQESEKNDWVEQNLSSTKDNPIEIISKMNDKSINDLQGIVGVLSLTAVPDNVLMWAHYANNHQGFCVGFDSPLLFKEFGVGSEIIYSENYPRLSPLTDTLDMMREMLYTKADYWDYEIEYRITKMNFANKIIKMPIQTIKEVIIGYKMSKSDKEDLVKIVKEFLPHVDVLMTSPKRNSFELELIKYS